MRNTVVMMYGNITMFLSGDITTRNCVQCFSQKSLVLSNIFMQAVKNTGSQVCLALLNMVKNNSEAPITDFTDYPINQY